ncbi:MAG: hypothetical protein ACRYFZ_19420 [Janthinobacterium lividum]
MTIMELRHRMMVHVRAERIDRKQYDSLFEVLCETHNLLPWHRDDVVRSIQLISDLLDQIEAK